MPSRRRRLRSLRGWISLSYLVLLFLIAATGRFWVPYDPLEMDFSQMLATPSVRHIFGTDEFGRDILSRVIWGAGTTLLVSFSSVSIAVCLGVALGLLSGYYRRLGDLVLMRGVDILLCFPPIFLAIAVVSLLGSSLPYLVLTIGILFAPQFARITHNQVAAVRDAPYVEAARAIGCPSRRILLRCILPNILSPLLVQASYMFAFAVLLESGLSFLGLGVMPPRASWGRMIGEAQMYLRDNYHMILWPSLAVTSTILAVNVMGDVLRDWADPRTRRRIG